MRNRVLLLTLAALFAAACSSSTGSITGPDRAVQNTSVQDSALDGGHGAGSGG